MAYQITTFAAPAEKVLTLTEAKAQVNVTFDADDALINDYIAAAQEVVEDATDLRLVTQTIDIVYDTFPWGLWTASRFTPGLTGAGLKLPLAPVQSVASVKYLDETGSMVTMPTDGYLVTPGLPGFVSLDQNAYWPWTRNRRGAVTVRAVVGYGNAAACPAKAKQAVRLLVGHYYANREAVAEFRGAELPMGVDRLVNALKWGSYP